MVYNNRRERAQYTVFKYKDYLRGGILDVGCWERELEEYLPNDVSYFGIDMAGKPDRIVDLEKEKIPLEDNGFDCVVCTDVLEHLDNLHKIFSELLRVSKKYIILSLPNNWLLLKNILLKKNSAGKLKFYGLPVQKPEDRHKWFFNIKEAEDFIKNNAERFSYKILICEKYFNPSIGVLKQVAKRILKLVLGDERYNNLFATALWVVLEKNG